MLILFPSDFFNIKKVDSDYEAEYNNAVTALPECRVALFNYDEFVADGVVKIYPKDSYSGKCIYRGWMLTPAQYKSLYDFLLNEGVTLINSPDEYDNCHLFPSAHSMIEPYTPKSLFFEQGVAIDWALINRTFKRFMVKDYVKSVKGMGFPTFFDTPVEAAEMDSRISEFVKLRDNLFTGGIVLKEYVDLKKYGETTNEYRAFFLKGELLSFCRNTNQCETCEVVPFDFIMKFSTLPSNYYTVDFGELSDGSWIVIETGDGQVSGLSPKQDLSKYYDEMLMIMVLPEKKC